jgi:hypothetical protein
VSAMDADCPAFEYDLRLLPRGRFTFRRWRWELWHGAVLRACGWRTSPGAAQRALRNAAAWWAHELAGARAPRPERIRALDPFALGATVRIDSGDVGCVLTPRGWADEP